MFTERDALLEAQYYCREMQVRKISEEEKSALQAEINTPEYRLFLNFALAHPFLRPIILTHYETNLESVSGIIDITVINAKKTSMVLSVLNDLAGACKQGNRSLKEISVDIVDNRIPENYKKLYTGRRNRLEEVIAEGLRQGSATIMKILEGNKTLTRYTKNFARANFKLQSGHGNTEAILIPTKIPNVDLLLAYPIGSSLPQASLLVKPFN